MLKLKKYEKLDGDRSLRFPDNLITGCTIERFKFSTGNGSCQNILKIQKFADWLPTSSPTRLRQSDDLCQSPDLVINPRSDAPRAYRLIHQLLDEIIANTRRGMALGVSDHRIDRPS